jgi:hypothetical protein
MDNHNRSAPATVIQNIGRQDRPVAVVDGLEGIRGN